jgi:hypothetical protein
MTGIEELRALVNMANNTREDAFDGLNAEETVCLLRACRALNLETLPDQLTPEGRAYAAKHGEVSTKELRRLYKAEGLPETGSDWVGR